MKFEYTDYVTVSELFGRVAWMARARPAACAMVSGLAKVTVSVMDSRIQLSYLLLLLLLLLLKKGRQCKAERE